MTVTARVPGLSRRTYMIEKSQRLQKCWGPLLEKKNAVVIPSNAQEKRLPYVVLNNDWARQKTSFDSTLMNEASESSRTS